jgi:diguanylate cyclase (GGDEF)-like protein
MEKGLRDFLLNWLQQPHEFDWTARHFRARGLLRVHQVFIGCFSLLYGVTALLTAVWAYSDGGSVGARILVIGIAASSAVLGLLWIFGPWPTERQSAAFAVYADLAVVAVMACYQDAFTAMPGLALLATNGIYVVVVHGPRALLVHLTFTVGVIAWMTGLAVVQDTYALSVITVRLLVLVPTVVGIPVIVQSYLLALRVGALDSLHDPLTLLYNRRGLDDQLERIGGGTHIGVLAVDIDKFKAVNDSHGHEAGDRVLVAVANAARDAVSALGVGSVIARTGGEEFVVVIDGGADALLRTAEILHEAVARSDVEMVPTVSIGAATGRAPGPGVHGAVRGLIERADAAMYRAKHAGGNRTVLADGAVPVED